MDRDDLAALLDRETGAVLPLVRAEPTFAAWCTRQPAHEVHVPPLDADLIAVHLEGPADVASSFAGSAVRQARTVPGDVTFLPAGMHWHSRVLAPVGFLHIWLPPASRDPGAERSLVGPREGLAEHAPRVLRLATAVLAHLRAPDSVLEQDALATELRREVDALYRGVRAKPSPERPLTSGEARRARDYLEANLTRDVRLLEIAHEVGMSAFYFARCFKTTFGSPPHRYVVELRVKRAKALLATSRLPLGAIANATGFGTQARFTTVFREVVGLSPGAFRAVVRL